MNLDKNMKHKIPYYQQPLQSSPLTSSTGHVQLNVSPIPQYDAVSFFDISPSSSVPPFESLLDSDNNSIKGDNHEEKIGISTFLYSTSFIEQLDGTNDKKFNGLAGINCNNEYM